MHNINLIKSLDNFSYFIFLILPLTFVIGTAAVNISVFLSIFCLIYISYRDQNWQWIKDKIFIFFMLYFIYLILNNILFNYQNLSSEKMLKILGYGRFIFLVYFISAMFQRVSNFKKKFFINFNFFLIVFIILDILIQMIFGSDIFGFSGGMCFGEYTEINFKTLTKEYVLSDTCQRFAGPFNQEFIAGSFIVFLGSLIFALKYLHNSELEKRHFYFLISLAICFLATLITGDRNPFISLLIVLFIFFVFEKNTRKYFLRLSCIFFLLGVTTIVSNLYLYERYVSVGRELLSIPDNVDIFKFKKDSTRKVALESENISRKTNIESKNYGEKIKIKFYNTQWGAHYLTSIEMLKERPITGHGHNSYRVKCKNYDYIESAAVDIRCSTHPHNYIIQLLSETGFVGFSLYTIFLLSIFIKFNYFKDNIDKPFTIFLLALLFSFIFPIKPSGSIFSSMNNSFLFYLIGWVVYSLNLNDIRFIKK